MRSRLPWLALVALACSGGSDPKTGLTSTTPTSSTSSPSGPTTPTTPDTTPPTGTTATADTAPTDTALVAFGDPADLSLPAHASVANGRFSTSDVCAQCHDNVPTSDALTDEDGRGIAPYDLWQGTMMANAGRDPLWRAQVSAELAATPAAAEAIGAKCTRCHTPMASGDAELLGASLPLADVVTDLGEAGDLARDGVSCTVCHQIEPDGLRSEASFSGGWVIEGQGRAYGPHAAPFEHPMQMHSGFTPVESAHVMDSAVCATCHTLTTHALADDGTATGGDVVEQAPYLEWQLSDYADTVSCAGCHLPTRSEDGVPITTEIAHSPDGGDFGPVGPRSPVGRHVLVGGNTLMPAVFRAWRSVLQPPAPDAAFEATEAAARAQLAGSTGQVALQGGTLDGDVLRADVVVTSQVGHKLPSGIPVRRAWLRLEVTDADGTVWLSSGAWDAMGRLVDGSGAVLASDQVGGPVLPHRDEVSSSDEAVVYEAILADGAGDPTFLLMRGEGWVKDTRLLPAGFDRAAAGPIGIDSVGVDGDVDFVGGGDTVHLAVPVAGGVAPYTVTATLVYQPLSARWAAELAASGTDEALAFEAMLGSVERGPEVVAEAVGEVR